MIDSPPKTDPKDKLGLEQKGGKVLWQRRIRYFNAMRVYNVQ